MDILFLVGRILYGGYFIMQGLNHFMKNEMLSGYAQSKGVPSSKAAVYISGLMILFGGLGIVFGAYIPYSVALIAVFLLVITFKMHAFWAVQDPMSKMGDMVNFYKNLALLGADIMLLMITQPWPISLSL